MLIAVALLAGTVGVAYASGEALPGDSLYGLKRGLERAALALTASSAVDTRLLLQFADRRLGEADELLQRGRPADLAQALDGYETAIGELLEIAAQEPDQLDEVADALARHELKLQSVLDQAPEQAKPGLTRALERSQHGMDTVEEIRDENRQDDLPPGQLKKTPGAEDAADPIPPGQLKKSPTPED
jgi:crotonobetainyl-CoA:carnitine CoA-transferase CaiB-like acyl-CoA transferase